MTRRWMTWTLGLLAVGCAETAAQRIESEGEIRNAQASGAAAEPAAAAHLQLAQTQLEVARKLEDAGDAAGAQLKLVRAEIDARMASTLTRQMAVKADANKALEQIRALESSMPPR